MTPVLDTIVRFIIAVLFNGLWEAALLALVAWVALRAMPNGNATTRHSVLVAALIASLVLPVATAVVTIVHPSFAPPSTVTVPAKLPKIVTPDVPAQATPTVAAPPRPNIALPRWVALSIVVLWLLGALFVLARLVVSLLHLERLKKDALPVAVEYRAELTRWNAATKGSRTVRLCRSHEIAIPIAVGLFDAMILIPERFLEELEPADVDRIVLHELAHLRRADDWINAVERLASALFFFNPGIAWLVAQLDLEREVACDDWVLQQNDPLPYANCLAKVVESAVWPYRAMSAPGAFLTRRAMSVRIERLLTAHRDVRVRTSLGPTGIVVAAVAALGIGAALVSPSFAYTVSPATQSSEASIVHRKAVVRHIARQSVPKVQAPVTTVRATAAATASPPAKPSAAKHPAEAEAEADSDAAAMAVSTAMKTSMKTSMKVASSVAQSVGTSQQIAANSPAYIDELAQAGYTNLTVDQLIELKSLGVTGDYIRSIENAGFSHPSVRDLVQLRSLGVTGDYIRGLANAGLTHLTVEQVVRLRSLGIQDSYVRAMKQYYDAVDEENISRLKAVGVTPEYVQQMASAGYPHLSGDDLVRLKSVGVDPAFVATAKAHGFINLTVEQLIRLKTSGVI